MSAPVVESVNTKYISIVPENGEQFTPGQKIIYNLEPNIGFMKRDSYFIFDLLNMTEDFGRYGLNALAGVHSIVENIRIYSKMTGVLLESCENYGQIQGLIHQYGHDDREDIVSKEGVGIPCMAKFNAIGGGSIRSLLECQEIENQRLSPVDTAGNPKYTQQRYIMSLRCGIFRYFDAERLIPILNFGGLRIEINLQRPELVLQKLSCSVASAASPTGFANSDLINTGVACAATTAGAGANNSMTILGIGQVANCGFAVGNNIRIEGVETAGGAAVDVNRTITAIVDAAAANTTTITFAGGALNDLNANATIKYLSTVTPPNYRVQNTEMRVCQVVPTKQQEADLRQSLNYEFTTWDLFLDNIPTAGARHQTPLNSVASKALAILSMPYDSSQEANLSNQQYYSGDVPSNTNLNSVQFFINNRLYPLRAYNPQTLNDRVLSLNETQKALKSVGLTPLCLGRNIGSDLENYNQTFLVSRELARNGFVFDLRNAEAEIRTSYSAARTNITRVNTFVFSKKIIETTESGVAVIL